MTKHKLVIIGLDGGTLSIFEQLGLKFPQILKQSGVLGTMSQVSKNDRGWATLLTGKDASWHGGYYWRPAPSSYIVHDKFTCVDYLAEPLWETLNNTGIVQGYLGVPTTYPPPAVKGFFISGAGGGSFPSLEDCSNPKGFVADNLNLFSSYIHDVRPVTHAALPPIAVPQDLAKAAKIKGTVARGLIRKYDPDLFMTVYVGPDRIQHYLWPKLTKCGETPNDEICAAIANYYRVLDEELCEFIEEYKTSRNILICSDHGFAPRDFEFSVNSLLCELGFAAAKSPTRSTAKSRLFAWSKDRLPERFRKFYRKVQPYQGSTPPALDWNKSVAFGNAASGVFINRKERYPNGIVSTKEYEPLREKLMLALESAQNPINNQRILTRVTRREDIYKGPQAWMAPDITFEAPENCEVMRGLDSAIVRRFRPAPLSKGHLPRTLIGIHAPGAIFGAIGPDICRVGDKLKDEPFERFHPLVRKLLGFKSDGLGSLSQIFSNKVS